MSKKALITTAISFAVIILSSLIPIMLMRTDLFPEVGGINANSALLIAPVVALIAAIVTGAAKEDFSTAIFLPFFTFLAGPIFAGGVADLILGGGSGGEMMFFGAPFLFAIACMMFIALNKKFLREEYGELTQNVTSHTSM